MVYPGQHAVIDNNDCKFTKQKSSILPRYFNLFEQSFYFSRVSQFSFGSKWMQKTFCDSGWTVASRLYLMHIFL